MQAPDAAQHQPAPQLGGQLRCHQPQQSALERVAGLQIGALAIGAAAYGLAVPLGASGFIAAWLAGLLIGRTTRDKLDDVAAFSETLGTALTMISFTVFGAVLLGPAIEDITWQVIAYGALSLTVIRMIPVALAMIGSGLQAPSVLFVGWFGPRGLASIVLTGVVIESTNLPGTETIVTVAMVTVGIDVGEGLGQLIRSGKTPRSLGSLAGEPSTRQQNVDLLSGDLAQHIALGVGNDQQLAATDGLIFRWAIANNELCRFSGNDDRGWGAWALCCLIWVDLLVFGLQLAHLLGHLFLLDHLPGTHHGWRLVPGFGAGIEVVDVLAFRMLCDEKGRVDDCLYLGIAREAQLRLALDRNQNGRLLAEQDLGRAVLESL